MKKMLFWLAGALLLASCTQLKPTQKTMTINGQIDPILEMDSAEVTLTIATTDTVLQQTTVLANNAFALVADADSVQITTLQIDGLGRYVICVEPGTVNFVVTANDDPESKVAAFITCTGTPNNDLLNEYNEAENAAIRQLMAATSDDEQIEVEKAFYDMTYDFILAHINTLASTHIFADASYYLELEEVGYILDKLTEESLAYGRIPRVKAGYEAMVKTKVGEPFTDFALPTPEGEELALSELVGQTDYVLVDFWASWCGPCRRAMPALKELYAANQGKLEILGVSLDNDAEAWTGAIKNLGLNWKHISDLQGWKCAAGQLYGVSAIPATVLINKEGIIVGRNLTEAEIAAFLIEE